MTCNLPLLWSGPPSWWSKPGVFNNNNPDDYAVANIGQLKHLATEAREELNDSLPNGSGRTVDEIINLWRKSAAPSTLRDDYAAVTLGQLKAVATPFYQRLLEAGYTTEFPWTNAAGSPDDYAVANLGQLKQVFSFDLSTDTDNEGLGDGLPDWWEQQYGQGLDLLPNEDSDLDGFTNIQEFNLGTNPTAADSDGDGVVDGLDSQPNSVDPQPVRNVHVISPSWENEYNSSQPDFAAVDYTKVEIRWESANSFHHGLKVERQIDGGAWRLVANLGAGATKCPDQDLLANTKYLYRVVAQYSVGGVETSSYPQVASYEVPLDLRLAVKTTANYREKKVDSTPEFGTQTGNYYLSRAINSTYSKTSQNIGCGDYFGLVFNGTTESDPLNGTVTTVENYDSNSSGSYYEPGTIYGHYYSGNETSSFRRFNQKFNKQHLTSVNEISFDSHNVVNTTTTDIYSTHSDPIDEIENGSFLVQTTYVGAHGNPFWTGEGYEYQPGDYYTYAGFSNHTSKDGTTQNAVLDPLGSWSQTVPYSGDWRYHVDFSNEEQEPNEMTPTRKVYGGTGELNEGGELETTTYQTTFTLSNPYTTDALIANTLSAMPDYRTYDDYYFWRVYQYLAVGTPNPDWLYRESTLPLAWFGTSEKGDAVSYAKFRYKIAASPSAAHTLTWLEVFNPEDDQATPDVDESKNTEVIHTRNWQMGTGTESQEYEIAPSTSGRKGLYSVLLMPVSLHSEDRILRGSITIPYAWNDVSLSFKNKRTGQDLGRYEKLESGAADSTVKIYDSPDDFFSNEEMEQNAAGTLPSAAKNQAVTFARDPENPQTLRFCAIFDDLGEVEVRVKFGPNQIEGIVRQTLTPDSDMSVFLNKTNERVASLEVPGAEDIPIDLDGDGVPDGSNVNDLIQASQPGTMATPGALIGEELEDDPLNLVLAINNDDDTDDGIGIPDNADTQITALDNDVARLLLKRPGNLVENTGTLTLTVSNPAVVRIFNSSGTAVLNSYTVDLAAPVGDFAGLATGSVPIFLEGLTENPDLVVTLTYRNAANAIVSSDSVHLTVAGFSSFAGLQNFQKNRFDNSKLNVRRYAANGSLQIETLDMVTVGANPPLQNRGLLAKVLWESSGQSLAVPFVLGFVDGFWVSLKGEKDAVVGIYEFFRHDPFGRAAAMTGAVIEAVAGEAGRLSTMSPGEIYDEAKSTARRLQTIIDNTTFGLYTEAERQLPWESTTNPGDDVLTYIGGFACGTVTEGVVVTAIGAGVVTKASTVIRGIIVTARTTQVALETLGTARKAAAKLLDIQLRLAKSEKGAIDMGAVGKFLEKTEMPSGEKAAVVIEEALHDKPKLTDKVVKNYESHYHQAAIDEERAIKRIQKSAHSLADLKDTMGENLTDKGLESFTKLQERMFVTENDYADSFPKLKKMFKLETETGKTRFNQFLEDSKSILEDPASNRPDLKDNYPKPNNGAVRQGIPKKIEEGKLLTRYGLPSGKFMSLDDPDFIFRSLPGVESEYTKFSYIVIKEFTVAESGLAAPWFGKPGGSDQIFLKINDEVRDVDWLILNEYIEKLP